MEATMAFPLIILALVTAVFILTFQYAKVAALSEVHTATLREAGEVTGNYGAVTDGSTDVSVSEGYHLARKTVKGEKTVSMRGQGLIRADMEGTPEGRSYALDEKKEIRMVDLFEEAAEGSGT